MRLCDEVLRSLGNTNRRDVRQLPALTLAYVGDTVYDLFVRTMLVCTRGLPVHDLHTLSSERVNAGAQARAARAIMDELTEEELAVYKRGRNAKSHTVPKNANVGDYRVATGLEAVLGFLYLSGREERAFELLATAMSTAPRNPANEEEK